MYAPNSSSDAPQAPSIVAELLDALSNTLNDARDSAEQRLRRVAALLQRADTARLPAVPDKGGLAPWQVRAVVRHVETNLDRPIRSSELAAVVRLNPCYFSRAFRESFGDSPLRYVTRLRVERAQRLMLSTGEPLSQIALDCGFADQAHFSRLFRRVTSYTPRAWRRARIGAPAARSGGRARLLVGALAEA